MNDHNPTLTNILGFVVFWETCDGWGANHLGDACMQLYKKMTIVQTWQVEKYRSHKWN